MIDHITEKQWNEIKRCFENNSEGFSSLFISDGMHSIDVGLGNDQVSSIFNLTVVRTQDFTRQLNTTSWSGAPNVYQIHFTLDPLAGALDLNQLNTNLQTFCRDIKSPLIPKQCMEIYHTFDKHSDYYSVTTPVKEISDKTDNTPATIQLQFYETRSYEQFKIDVANKWDLTSYHYDDNKKTVAISMDHPLGLKKFDRLMLIDTLEQMNKNIKITTKECEEIQQIFNDRLAEMNIPVESKITTNDRNSLEIKIAFKSTQEADEFEKEVLTNIRRVLQVDTRTSENNLNQTLAITQYFEKVVSSIKAVLMRAFDNMQAKFITVPKDLTFFLISAIGNGMHDNNTYYPEALINIDSQKKPYVCILLKKNEEDNQYQYQCGAEFDRFLQIFPQLCYKYQIDKQTKKQDFACRKELPNDLIKYEFNVTPEALHKILMEESDYYRGYRSGHSIIDLANPTQTLTKQDVMCLFPVLPLDEEHLLIRNAGCNVSETLSVQLSFFAQACLPELYGTTSAYGHHASPIMNKLGINADDLIKAALMCAGMDAEDIQEYGHQEAQDGLVPIFLKQSHHNFLKNMDDSAKQIYSISAVTPKELEQLNSLEVPIRDYLEKLLIVLKEKEKTAEIVKKPALTQSILNIQNLMSKITKTEVTSPKQALSAVAQREMKKELRVEREKNNEQVNPKPSSSSRSP